MNDDLPLFFCLDRLRYVSTSGLCLGQIRKSNSLAQESKHEAVGATMRQINRVWLNGQVESLAPMVHPEIVMVFPNFIGRTQGREEFLAGFSDFCQNAKIHEFRDHDHQIDIAGNTAVVSFRYEMVYERSGEQYHATGRDLWVFENQSDAWIAVWRTMLDMEEKPRFSPTGKAVD
ncbi:MAG TPA: nuclear transport factor 2 family protein [Bryobacteraceae bacterium]|nr:nuclear transport factor 2 family protein [Bryobacteraceae bacterium]